MNVSDQSDQVWKRFIQDGEGEVGSFPILMFHVPWKSAAQASVELALIAH